MLHRKLLNSYKYQTVPHIYSWKQNFKSKKTGLAREGDRATVPSIRAIEHMLPDAYKTVCLYPLERKGCPSCTRERINKFQHSRGLGEEPASI